MRSVFAIASALLLLAASAAPARAGVVIYRCTDANGAVTVQNDTPCAKGQQQETRSMVRPRDAPNRVVDTTPAPRPEPAPAPTRTIVYAPPLPMYECRMPDGTTYTSDSAEGNLRWVPMWTLGWSVPAGTWVRDECRKMPQAETCSRLRDRRDAIERRFFNAMPSERARLDVEERGIDARLDADCGGR